MEEVVISRAGDNGENEMAQSDWDHCRREARRLESEIETKLVAYSKFSANYRQSASESALLLSAAPSAPAHDSSVSSVSSPSAGSSHLPDPSAGAVPASPFSGQEHINATMSLEIEQCLERVRVCYCVIEFLCEQYSLVWCPPVLWLFELYPLSITHFCSLCICFFYLFVELLS